MYIYKICIAQNNIRMNKINFTLLINLKKRFFSGSKFKTINVISVLTILLIVIIGCNNKKSLITIENKYLKLELNKFGEITNFLDKNLNKNFIDFSEKSYLMSLRINGEYLTPVSIENNNENLILGFPSGVSATILVKQKSTHFTFELIKLSGNRNVELIVWGPYYNTINNKIGETVGVVRDESFALGIQALNIKTIGGYPWKENDQMPNIDFFDIEDYNNINDVEKKRFVLYNIEAAKPTNTGSSLQAYCRNRYQDRIIETNSHEKFLVPAYNDGGIIGSKIALFGCPVDSTLKTIENIEILENLPHPIIDGKWGKISPGASAAYLILDFSEYNIDSAIKITKKAGLKYLYHSNPFETWGHFKLKKDLFPNGYKGLKMCVEKAKKQNVNLGVHTLSNFITTNDPYITPIPDKRLAKVGSSKLTEDINKTQKSIPIESPIFFNQFKNNNLKTVYIGNELIRYEKVSDEEPWMLLNCQRGAFNTNITNHKKGSLISKLLDHSYKVFLTNTELTTEVSKNIADLFNQTGIRQISFDGLEGNNSTGLGNYGISMMPYIWYNALTDELKKHLIIDASNTTHFFWHIYSRMNWGEPWYAGFRESQRDYRMNNQKYFRRNLMPGMLGWFKMSTDISLEDMEWMLSRSAAYDAGYSFITNFNLLNSHGMTNRILELIKQWEKARMSGAFSTDLKKQMENLDNEYHLESLTNKKWNLYPIKTEFFTHENKEKQPGEPTSSTFKFVNKFERQPMIITIQAIDDTKCQNISIELNNYAQIFLPIELKDNQILYYSGKNEAILFNRNWEVIKKYKIKAQNFNIDNGENNLSFNAEFSSRKKYKIKAQIKMYGKPIIVESSKQN